MPTFKYKAMNKLGRVEAGTINVKDVDEVKAKLKEGGWTPIKIQKGFAIEDQLRKLLVSKFSKRSLSVFCNQFSVVLKSGVNILRGLEMLRNQPSDKKMGDFVSKVYEDVQKGLSLSDAMSLTEIKVPPLLVFMVAMGETSGNLDQIMERLSDYYEKEALKNQKLIGAMIYPAIMFFVAIAMVLFFINFVIPEIATLITDSGGELPLITRFVLGSADILKNYYYMFILVFLTIGYSIFRLSKIEKYRYKMDGILLKMPIIGVSISQLITSRFLRCTSMMLKSGVNLIEVLESVEKILGNLVARKVLIDATEKVKKGSPLSFALEQGGLFAPMVINMINVGEETGELDFILENAADFYDKESDIRLNKMMALIEPAFIIIMGIVMGFLIISMILPMFDMLGTMNGIKE